MSGPFPSDSSWDVKVPRAPSTVEKTLNGVQERVCPYSLDPCLSYFSVTNSKWHWRPQPADGSGKFYREEIMSILWNNSTIFFFFPAWKKKKAIYYFSQICGWLMGFLFHRALAGTLMASCGLRAQLMLQASGLLRVGSSLHTVCGFS